MLADFITELGIPMLISLELNFCYVSPIISSETSQVEYHIIGGAHLKVKAMNFSKENADCCCGKELSFDKITHGFAFVPGGIEYLKCSMLNQDTIWYQGLLCV